MKTFGEYLAGLRKTATVASGPALSTSAVKDIIVKEYIARHETAIFYEFLGDDENGAPVYRIGSTILLQDVQTQLNSLVTSKDIKRLNFKNSYGLNPSLMRD